MRITRRGLLLGAGVVGGGLLLGTVGIASYVATYDQRRLQQRVLDGSKVVAQWITVDPDGHVTLHGPHTEMGQGTQTSLLQILLDEMDADPTTTSYALAPADAAFTLSDLMEGFLTELTGIELDGLTGAFVRDALGRAAQVGGLQFTGGSTAVRFTGWVGIRRAAASARAMLAQAGADALGVPLAEVRTADSRVHHDASGRSLSYGELAEAASLLPLPDEVPYKDPASYRFIGTRFPRIDLPEKVFGEPVYGIDVEVPGMRYAAVAPPPLAQGRVTGVRNQAEVEARRGVEAVVLLPDAVAVVADNPWRAEQAARALDIACDPPEGGPIDHEADEARRLAGVAAGGDRTLFSYGDGVASLEGDDVVEATYVTPYYVHAPMEPMNATVWEEGGKHHVATGTQGPLNTRWAAAKALGCPIEEVVLHAKTMGGGFGRRNALLPSSLNWVRQACAIQKAVGGAVKMTWSREADVRMSTYHPADAARMRARLGPDGRPVEWLHDLWAGDMPTAEVMPPYTIPAATARTCAGSPRLPFGYWRSVVAFTTVHFIESFVEELAARGDHDPLDYRLGMLDDPGRAVLERVAALAGWEGPRVGERGYGIAYTKTFGSRAAAIAEVSLEGGQPRVHRLWCTVDCGIPVNPGSVEAQAQGALYWGVSAALHGQLAFEQGAMKASNFHDYKVATMRDGPRITVDVMTDTGTPIGGVGELATPLAAPAIANALAALGDRRRRLPLLA